MILNRTRVSILAFLLAGSAAGIAQTPPANSTPNAPPVSLPELKSGQQDSSAPAQPQAAGQG